MNWMRWIDFKAVDRRYPDVVLLETIYTMYTPVIESIAGIILSCSRRQVV